MWVPAVGVKVTDRRVPACASPQHSGAFAAHPQAGAKRSLNPVTWGEGSDVVKPDRPPKPPKPRTPLLPPLSRPPPDQGREVWKGEKSSSSSSSPCCLPSHAGLSLSSLPSLDHTKLHPKGTFILKPSLTRQGLRSPPPFSMPAPRDLTPPSMANLPSTPCSDETWPVPHTIPTSAWKTLFGTRLATVSALSDGGWRLANTCPSPPPHQRGRADLRREVFHETNCTRYYYSYSYSNYPGPQITLAFP